MKLFLVLCTAVLSVGIVQAQTLALPATGEPVTLIFPDEPSKDFAQIQVTEVDRTGRELQRIESVLEEQVLADPDIRICRVLRFSPEVGEGMRYYRLEAVSGPQPVRLPKENLFPTGDFEKGWYLGKYNPGTTTLASGRGNGKAIQFDMREINNGGPVVASSEPAELLKLKDPANLPALMRLYIKTESGESEGNGIVLRMRRWNEKHEYITNYYVWNLQGGAVGDWEERQVILQNPLAENTASMDIYLVNMAPRDGVCFLIDDLEILPIKKAEPIINVRIPEEELYEGDTLTVTVEAGTSSQEILKLSELAIPVSIDGIPAMLAGHQVETTLPELSGGEVTVELYADDSLVLSLSEPLGDQGGEVNLQPTAGNYKLIATVKLPDGKTVTHQFDYQICDNPFTME